MKNDLIALTALSLCYANTSYAVDNYLINGDNFSYSYDVYQAGEAFVLGDESKISTFNIPNSYLSPLFTASKSWASVINSPANVNPVTYALLSENEYNASAGSLYVDVEGKPYRVTMVNAAINGLKPTGPKEILEASSVDGFVFLGLGVEEDQPGWEPYSGLHSLYHGQLPDLHVVMLHEIMHSLGISSAASQVNEDQGDEVYYFTEKDGNLSVFDKDLRIYTGKTSAVFNPALEIKAKPYMSIGKGEDFDVMTYAPYYVGDNTLKVLSGEADYDDAKQAIIDNGGLTNYSISYGTPLSPYPQVFGLPIHNADDDEIDLSHIELRNSFMSHQNYRNWMVPMEAELAVLKDIGYDIDLRKYFGKSYYLNDITDTFTTGYSEWNGSAYTGVASDIAQGVGLHIYGDRNNITQASNTVTVGEGAIGVRIDGVKNKYTLADGNSIQTNGKENLGIAVTWGKNHVITVEQGATVVANGENGKAVSFDFGANLFGSLDTAKGSYINYDSDFGYNKAPGAETSSALVDTFNVAGMLQGSKAAIYISDNSHVKNINIHAGAQITGDIISEWNSVQSGQKAKVQRYNGSYWVPVNPYDESQIYYTNINVYSAFDGVINGNISGDNEIHNTLKLNNLGNLTIAGDTIDVAALDNSGVLNIYDADLTVQSGEITGGGTLNVNQKLAIDSDLTTIDNTVNLATASLFSAMNGGVQDIEFYKLNADDAKISFDIGDTFLLANASSDNTASIAQLKTDEEIAVQLRDGAQVELFASDNTLDLGTSSANIYYGGNKYTLTQNAIDMRLLDINLTATDVELGDAVADETASNYIVTEAKLNKDAGTVQGDDFEISGESIDVNGHKGLVIDGSLNAGGTKLKTDIFGASDSDLTLVNGGKLLVDATQKSITLGQKGENALQINNGEAVLYAENDDIYVRGNIKGTDNQTDTLTLAGGNIALNNVQNVKIDMNNTDTHLNGMSVNSIWQADNGVLTIKKEAYMSSDGSNQLIVDGGAVNLVNNETGDIALSKLTLNKTLETALDVDFVNLEADRFVFADSSDLETNNNTVYISKMNLLNSDVILSAPEYAVPFVGAEYNSEDLINSVVLNVDTDTLISPIFNYHLGYQKDENTGSIVLSRGPASDYKSYNSSVLAAPVAAQTGNYLAQLSIYDKVFGGIDTLILPVKQNGAGRGISSGDRPISFNIGTVWFNPSYTHERVDLKKGPSVKNKMYNALAGRDSGILSANGWNYQYSVYAGYDGSQQRYSGNSIHQNGGIVGVTGAWYKNNFFTALTADAGMSFAKARTMYGSEKFKTVNAGIASKSGYNWLLADGRFIIQPNYTMSYTYVKTLKYKNAGGVHIKPDPLHAINIAPGIKTVYNFANGFKPYAQASMVWNLLDKTKFKAQDVKMPEMSVKPYVKYGLGLQKDWCTKVSAFGEVMRLDGGREGFDFSAGLRWTF